MIWIGINIETPAYASGRVVQVELCGKPPALEEFDEVWVVTEEEGVRRSAFRSNAY